MLDDTDPKVMRVAVAFANTIRAACADLDGDPLAEIIARNATPDYAGACATHDFFDANMAMGDAFESIYGRWPDAASEADAAIINAAWDIAKACEFFRNQKGN